MRDPQIPSGEVMLDLKAVAEKLISPEDELEAVMLLAVAGTPQGKTRCGVYFVPLDEQGRLLGILREYLAGPPGLIEHGRD
jgi:hypothetical protein